MTLVDLGDLRVPNSCPPGVQKSADPRRRAQEISPKPTCFSIAIPLWCQANTVTVQAGYLLGIPRTGFPVPGRLLRCDQLAADQRDLLACLVQPIRARRRGVAFELLFALQLLRIDAGFDLDVSFGDRQTGYDCTMVVVRGFGESAGGVCALKSSSGPLCPRRSSCSASA